MTVGGCLRGGDPYFSEFGVDLRFEARILLDGGLFLEQIPANLVAGDRFLPDDFPLVIGLNALLRFEPNLLFALFGSYL